MHTGMWPSLYGEQNEQERKVDMQRCPLRMTTEEQSGAALKWIMDKYKIGNSELAREIGVAPCTIQRARTSAFKPTLPTAHDIVDGVNHLLNEVFKNEHALSDGEIPLRIADYKIDDLFDVDTLRNHLYYRTKRYANVRRHERRLQDRMMRRISDLEKTEREG